MEGIAIVAGLVVAVILLIGVWLWLVIRIGKSSPVGAIPTLVFIVPAFYYLVKNWNHAEHDIRMPFFVNLAMSLLVVTVAAMLPSYLSQMYSVQARQASQRQNAADKPSLEMNNWCRRENPNTVYSMALGTCVEAAPGVMPGTVALADADLFVQLQHHFSRNGLAAVAREMDKAAPGVRNMKSMPGIGRVAAFEVAGKYGLPTVFLAAECENAETCQKLRTDLNQPDAPVTAEVNGNLLFIGVHLLTDRKTLEQAEVLFIEFKAQ